MQFVAGDPVQPVPTLRGVIPHGGPVPYLWGHFRGLPTRMRRPPVDGRVMKNVFFGTCV